MKRLKLLATMGLLTLLLSACELPEDWGRLWREVAFVNLGFTQFRDLLWIPMSFFTLAAIYMGSRDIAKADESETREVTLKWVGIMFFIVAIPIVIPGLTAIARGLAWPESLTLDVVMSRMGWTFPLPEGDVNPWTLTAGMVFTAALPGFFSLWEFALGVIYLVCLMATIFNKSAGPMTPWGMAAGSWLLFPPIYNLMTSFFGAVRPEGAVAGRVVATIMMFNFWYLVLLGVIIVVLCFGPAVLGIVYTASYIRQRRGEADRSPDGKRKLSTEEVGAILAAAGATIPKNGQNQQPSGESPSDGEPPFPEGDEPEGPGSSGPAGFSGERDKVRENDYLAPNKSATTQVSGEGTPQATSPEEVFAGEPYPGLSDNFEAEEPQTEDYLSEVGTPSSQEDDHVTPSNAESDNNPPETAQDSAESTRLTAEDLDSEFDLGPEEPQSDFVTIPTRRF